MLVPVFELGFEWLDVDDGFHKPLLLDSVDDELQVVNEVAVVGALLAETFEGTLHDTSPLLSGMGVTSLVMNLTLV